MGWEMEKRNIGPAPGLPAGGTYHVHTHITSYKAFPWVMAFSRQQAAPDPHISCKQSWGDEPCHGHQ